jgi:proteasome alpha subunit
VSIPFGYVSPEQVLKDKADYARKGIARGRALVAATYADGVVLCAENSSTTLHKVSEIYDRIAFAGVGRYNEFDSLRIAGVRAADLKGFSYSREDVDARSLANQYASIVGNVFTHELKPLEVEILVAEISELPGADQLFQIRYDGTVMDEGRFVVIGGESDTISERLVAAWQPGMDRSAVLKAAVAALAGPDRVLTADDLEVAVLARSNGRRAFHRLDDVEVASVLQA